MSRIENTICDIFFYFPMIGCMKHNGFIGFLELPMIKKISQLSPLLWLIGIVEYFERFGFYTVQGIMVLYLLKVHHFSSTHAFHIMGAFSALVYGFVGLGGWCGDRLLGQKKTLLLGLIVMFCGYVGLAALGKAYFFAALAGVCLGNALFKANPGALLGQLFHDDKVKLHSAFTWFYMSVNLGALLALIVGPFLSTHKGYHYAFGASAIGIAIAIAVVLSSWNKIEVKTPEPVKIWVYLVIFIVVLMLWGLIQFLLSSYHWVILGLKIIIGVVLAIYLMATFQQERRVRRRLFAVLILMIEAVLFFTLYHQMPTSINLYAILHVYPTLFGIHFDPQSFQALNPLWIIIWSPFLTKMYQKNALGKTQWSIFHKFAMGMFCCGLSYLVLYVSHYFADEKMHISAYWLVGSYIFQSVAELLVSALGLAMVAELVPQAWMGAVMGMWFLTSSVSGFTGAKLASMMVAPKVSVGTVASLNSFAQVFGEIALVTFGISFLMFISVRGLQKLTE
ncbi:MAG: MFS transporter [Gammaproteobacteria bacterium]|nr:MFS transporter [Gammaproteobacteria bacterium]